MRSLKHLPLEHWPKADIDGFARVYEPGDIFDETAGPGAHLAVGTRKIIQHRLAALARVPRSLLPGRSSVGAGRSDHARACPRLHRAARPRGASEYGCACRSQSLLRCSADDPGAELGLAQPIARRLAAQAKPLDRLDRLVPPWHILDYGIELMETAPGVPSDGHLQGEIQYRNGLLLAITSLWLIRRRSIEALTVSRHLEFDSAGANILLFPEDTKAKRDKSSGFRNSSSLTFSTI